MVQVRLGAFRRTVCVAALLGVAVAVSPSLLSGDDAAKQATAKKADAKKAEASDGKVFELRIYTCHPGKLEALHTRFRDHTMRLFEKHGIKNVIYLTPEDKDDTLVYLIVHESREAADKSWQAFRDDPQWKKVYEESHRDGPIVSKVERQFLKATDYSPQK